MPPIFKALITISVWVLFIVGWCATLTTGIMMVTAMPKPPMVAVANGIGGCVAFILACVAAWIRQKVE
jgi:hypothetical protein